MKFRMNRKTAVVAATAAVTASTLLVAPQANAVEVTYEKDAAVCIIEYDAADQEHFSELATARYQAMADTLYAEVPGIEQDVRAYAEAGRTALLPHEIAPINRKFTDAGYPGINHANFALELQRKALQKQKSPFNSRYQLEKTDVAAQLTGLDKALNADWGEIDLKVKVNDKVLEDKLIVAYRNASVQVNAPHKKALQQCTQGSGDALLSAANLSSGGEDPNLEKAKKIGIGVGVGAALYALLLLIGSFSPIWYPELQKAMSR